MPEVPEQPVQPEVPGQRVQRLQPFTAHIIFSCIVGIFACFPFGLAAIILAGMSASEMSLTAH